MLLRLLDIYSWILIIRVVMSWMNVNPYNPIVRIIYAITEPVLAPIRRALPSLGGLDFSPMIVLIAIILLRSIL